MEKLHLGARWLFRIRAYIALLILSVFFGWFVIPGLSILFLFLGNGEGVNVLPILLGSLLYIVIAVLIGEVYARMSYNRWYFEFGKSGMKLERGIIWKRYSNVPYERIQNVDVYRGILARMLGFSTVMIQTAGFSGYQAAEGNLPAVSIERAEEIRAHVMRKITKRGSGL